MRGLWDSCCILSKDDWGKNLRIYNLIYSRLMSSFDCQLENPQHWLKTSIHVAGDLPSITVLTTGHELSLPGLRRMETQLLLAAEDKEATLAQWHTDPTLCLHHDYITWIPTISTTFNTHPPHCCQLDTGCDSRALRRSQGQHGRGTTSFTREPLTSSG